MIIESIDLSSDMRKPAGRVLYDLYYSCIISCLLLKNEYSGYPNNGSEHTLCLKLNEGDLKAFFDLIQEYLEIRYLLYEDRLLEIAEGVQILRRKAGI